LNTLREDYSWTNHFQKEHPGYEFLRGDAIPWVAFEGSLLDAKVALVSTAGVYVRGQKPFSVIPGEVTVELMRYKFREKGDPSYRVIPASVDLEELKVAHSYLDERAAHEDINVVFPLGRLRELEEENFIGSVASHHISFMGYLPYPQDVQPFLKEAIGYLKKDDVNLVLLTPGEVLSHQTMGVVQQAFEEEGIATVSIALCRGVVEQVGVPRAVHYRFPFGFTLGDVNDQVTQLRIVKDTLRIVEEVEKPGTIVELAYQWVEE
jgi:D-proline reductase (dithiol) PrdB